MRFAPPLYSNTPILSKIDNILCEKMWKNAGDADIFAKHLERSFLRWKEHRKNPQLHWLAPLWPPHQIITLTNRSSIHSFSKSLLLILISSNYFPFIQPSPKTFWILGSPAQSRNQTFVTSSLKIWKPPAVHTWEHHEFLPRFQGYGVRPGLDDKSIERRRVLSICHREAELTGFFTCRKREKFGFFPLSFKRYICYVVKAGCN